jgi:pSer/pThr/pTyr-binding forkhead associated (FHA) protein
LENYLRNVCPELYGQQRDHSRETGDGEETTLLEEGGTMLLEDGTTLLENAQTVRAHLVRSSNYDRVDINKPVFRIGKEKSYVDYFVANNNAVSRIHADIVKRGESFYIKDNNSTNHTFVNGKMIDKNEEIEIFDGDAIMLANEGFEFHICG